MGEISNHNEHFVGWMEDAVTHASAHKQHKVTGHVLRELMRHEPRKPFPKGRLTLGLILMLSVAITVGVCYRIQHESINARGGNSKIDAITNSTSGELSFDASDQGRKRVSPNPTPVELSTTNAERSILPPTEAVSVSQERPLTDPGKSSNSPWKPLSLAEEPDTGVSSMRRDSENPTLVWKAPAEKPTILKANRLTGYAMIKVQISEEGKPVHAEILLETPTGLGLGTVAKDSALRSRYRPIMKNGRAVSGTLSIPYSF